VATAPAARPASVVVSLRLPGLDAAGDAHVRAAVKPGERVTIQALIRNQSGIVDNYTPTVEGLPEEWVTVTPPTVYLVPFGAPGGQYEQEVEVAIHPPRAPEAEAREWGIRVEAVSNASAAVVGGSAATVAIGPFTQLECDIEPQVRSGRRSASFAVSVRNRANAAATVALSGKDAEGACTLQFEQPSLTVARGERASTAFHVRPPKQIIVGRPTDRQLEVAATPVGVDEPAMSRQVVFRQRPWIPWWLPPIVMLVIAAIAAYVLTRPAAEKKVAVPDVVAAVAGLEPAAQAFGAQKLLESIGLKVGKPTPRDVADAALSGSVIDQSPKPGTKLALGKEVSLVVAQGTAVAKVPDLTGLTLKQALKKLSKVGLAVGEVSPAADTIDVQVDPIVATDPIAGKQVKTGTQVKIFVKVPKATTTGPVASVSSAAAAAVIPALAGKPLGAAADLLKRLGLAVAPVPRISAKRAGTVIETDPPAGATAPDGKVTAVVSAGYPEVVFQSQERLYSTDGAQQGKPRALTPDTVVARRPSWSPDGLVLAYSAGPDAEKARIVLHDATGAAADVPVTEKGGFDTDPAISPDGRTLAFVRSPTASGSKDSKLCFIALQPGAASSCVEDPGRIVHGPVWGASGKLVIARVDATADATRSTELLAYSAPEAAAADASLWTPASAPLTAGLHGGREAHVLSASFSPLAASGTVAVAANWSEDGTYRIYTLKLNPDGTLADRRQLGVTGCAVDWRRPDAVELLVVTSTANCGAGQQTSVVRVSTDLTQKQLVGDGTVLGIAWRPARLAAG
jgi:beta-lactam-binding protein with PASTA domain